MNDSTSVIASRDAEGSFGLDVRFRKRLRQMARVRPELAAALVGFARGTTQYLIVSTVFGLIVAVVDVAGLYLLDIPLPWLWGLLAFITNYIPNVGFVIGVVPPALLGLLEHGLSTMLWVIVGYSVVNFVIQSIIQLAKSFRMTVTAEGVETADDFTRMRDLGCHQIQGYLFGRPMSFEKASELVTGRAKAPADGERG